MSCSTNSEDPWTKGRNALWWWSSISSCLNNKNTSFYSWQQGHIYGIKKSCNSRGPPVGSDWQAYYVNSILSCLWMQKGRSKSITMPMWMVSGHMKAANNTNSKVEAEWWIFQRRSFVQDWRGVMHAMWHYKSFRNTKKREIITDEANYNWLCLMQLSM